MWQQPRRAPAHTGRQAPRARYFLEESPLARGRPEGAGFGSKGMGPEVCSANLGLLACPALKQCARAATADEDGRLRPRRGTKDQCWMDSYIRVRRSLAAS